ncbi:MAG TPA: tripartite tricarboxylate transporter TctB family protein [Paralcaligenes sp.]|jgi:hypothetical protein
MESNQENNSANGRFKWATYATADVVVATITLLVGIAMMVDSYRIGSGWSDGNLQPGYFPFRLGIIICIVSLAILAHALWGKNRNTRLFVQWGQLKRILAVFIPTLVYIFATEVIGIYVASALFIGAFMRLGGKHGWLKIIAVSAGTSVVLFVLFEIVFLVPLPKGPLEAFLGY